MQITKLKPMLILVIAIIGNLLTSCNHNKYGLDMKNKQSDTGNKRSAHPEAPSDSINKILKTSASIDHNNVTNKFLTNNQMPGGNFKQTEIKKEEYTPDIVIEKKGSNTNNSNTMYPLPSFPPFIGIPLLQNNTTIPNSYFTLPTYNNFLYSPEFSPFLPNNNNKNETALILKNLELQKEIENLMQARENDEKTIKELNLKILSLMEIITVSKNPFTDFESLKSDIDKKITAGNQSSRKEMSSIYKEGMSVMEKYKDIFGYKNEYKEYFANLSLQLGLKSSKLYSNSAESHVNDITIPLLNAIKQLEVIPLSERSENAKLDCLEAYETLTSFYIINKKLFIDKNAPSFIYERIVELCKSAEKILLNVDQESVVFNKNDVKGMGGNIYKNEGEAYFQLKKYDQALLCYNTAESQFQKVLKSIKNGSIINKNVIKDKFSKLLFNLYTNMASLYMAEEKTVETLQFYEKSFEAFDNSTYPISKEMIGYLIKNQLTMGKLLIKDKQFENVIKFYKTAIARINKSKAIADDNKNYIDELKNLITKAKECKKKHDLLKKHTKV